jgi:hypothetical protein
MMKISRIGGVRVVVLEISWVSGSYSEVFVSGGVRLSPPLSTPSLAFWIPFVGTRIGSSTSTTSSSHLAFKDFRVQVCLSFSVPRPTHRPIWHSKILGCRFV